MRKRALLYLLIIYIALVALIIVAAYTVFSIVGCGEIPATQQTQQGVSTSKFVRLVQVDKDGRKNISEVKKVNIKN